MRVIVTGGRVVDPSQKLDQEKDILIVNGLVQAIDQPGAFSSLAKGINGGSDSGAKVINAKGKVVCPGFIDVHVHLREPGFEYKETIASGTRAAVVGGFTSIAAMANTKPVNDNAIITKFILDRACEAKNCRVFPIGAVTKGLKGEELAEIGFMVEAGARALSDDGMPIMNSYLMRKAMEYARTFNVPIISHAEDLNLSQGAPMNEGAVSALLGLRGNPNASEEIMVAREVALARLTCAKIHIAHLSTREGIEHVKRAKEAGVNITAEVTPHHLMLNDSTLAHGGGYCTHHKMAPPLRTAEDQTALLSALNSGIIDMIASDHAPHGCVDKDTEFDLAANGILGLQTTVPLILELVHAGKLSLNRMIDALAVAPAKLLSLSDLGSLKVGAHADLTILDLNQSWTLTADQIVSKSTNSPFVERKFKGKVWMTLVGGEVKYE